MVIGTGADAADEADPDVPVSLRSALTELRGARAVRLAVLGVAALIGLDAFEEYVPLLADQWSVPVPAIPLVGLGLPLAGAMGARFGGARTASGRSLALRLALAGVLLLGACLLQVPAGLLAVFGFYAGYQAVTVSAGARLQEVLPSRSRATATSFAALAGEGTALGTYAAFAMGGGTGVAVLVGVTALVLPWCFPRRGGSVAEG